MASNLSDPVLSPVTDDRPWVQVARCAYSGLDPDEWFSVSIEPVTARHEGPRRSPSASPAWSAPTASGCAVCRPPASAGATAQNQHQTAGDPLWRRNRGAHRHLHPTAYGALPWRVNPTGRRS